MRLLFIVFLVNSVYAADSCCVDEDMAAAFLQHASYSRDWPASFPIEIDNEGFEYIGSGYEGRRTSVAWKSEMTVEDARRLVTEAILADGWVALPQDRHLRSRNERGFQLYQPASVSTHQQYCRGRDGILYVNARLTDIGTVVGLSHHPETTGRECAGMIAELQLRPRYSSGLLDYLPALTLPESIQGTRSPGSGSGGGSEGVSAYMSVKTSISAADMAFHFEPQMTDQQWTMDSSFQGSEASGHVWRRTIDGLNLLCIVTAVESDGGLRLRMHVEAP